MDLPDRPTVQLLARWCPPIAFMAMIFIASSLPAAGGIGEVPGGDKLLHAAGYAVLAVLVYRAMAIPRATLAGAAAAFAIAAVYGATDELHQWFVPSRTCALGDWLADAVGAAAGAGTWLAWGMRRRR
jgi:VanZ family protein